MAKLTVAPRNFAKAPKDPCYTGEGVFVCLFVCFLWRCGPMRAMASSFLRFLGHTQRRTTVGRTPLDGDQLVAETYWRGYVVKYNYVN